MRTIRKKMTISYVLLAIVCIIATSGLIAKQLIGTMGEQLEKQNNALAMQIADGLHSSTSSQEEVQQYIDRTKGHQEALAFIDVVDKDNKIIASSDKSKIGKEGDSKVKEVISFGKSKSEISAESSNDETLKVMIPVHGDHFGDGVLSVGISVNIDTKGILFSVIRFIILILILAIIVAYIVSIRIAKPIKEMTKSMQILSTGDFSVNFKANTKDEISVLADTMNKTAGAIRGIISGIQDSANSLDSVSQNLSTSTEQVAVSSEEVSRAIEEVAIGASKQSESISDTVNMLEDFSLALDEVNSKLQNVSDGSIKIKDAADIGQDKIKLLVDSINDVRKTFEYVIEKLSVLDDSVEKITTITDVINNVAEQTNLLALNAAIEAARVGDAGKGFAVVAEEIRKLAEQVLESSKGIAHLVNKITVEAKDVSETAQSVSSKMSNQTEDVEDTVISFKDIIKEVNNIVPQIDAVNENLNKALQSKNEVVRRVEDVALVSEEVSASAEEITSSVEEQNASIEELTATAKELAGMSKHMLEGIEKFKV